MDYKTAYFTLFNTMTDMIIELQEIQVKAEEIILSTDEPNIKILFPKE